MLLEASSKSYSLLRCMLTYILSLAKATTVTFTANNIWNCSVCFAAIWLSYRNICQTQGSKRSTHRQNDALTVFMSSVWLTDFGGICLCSFYDDALSQKSTRPAFAQEFLLSVRTTTQRLEWQLWSQASATISDLRCWMMSGWCHHKRYNLQTAKAVAMEMLVFFFLR